MRQLIALDTSLQRLTLNMVKDKNDPILRRYTSWDTSVLRKCCGCAGVFGLIFAPRTDDLMGTLQRILMRAMSCCWPTHS